jgi:hypothetical protein
MCPDMRGVRSCSNIATNGSLGVLRDPQRLARFFAVATALTSAETLEDVLKRTVHAARSLAHGDGATLTVTDGDSAETGRIFCVGYGGGRESASLERPILVCGRPYAGLRVTTSRTCFEQPDEELIDLLCTIAIENVSLRNREDILRQVRALVGDGAGGVAAPVREVGDIRVDLTGHEVFVAGERIHLTPSEFRVLELLTEESGRVYTRSEVLSRLWESEERGTSRVADAHVARLRRKIEPDPLNPQRLLTVRGVGYKLVPAGGPARVLDITA